MICTRLVVVVGSLWRTVHRCSGHNDPGILLRRFPKRLLNLHLSFLHSQEPKSTNYSVYTAMKDLKDQLPLTDSKTNFTIAVEGNIGSGKSTFLWHFDSLLDLEVYEEPIEKWTDVQGHNALGLLYENPERWSFSFNMYALLTRIQMHMKPQTKTVKIIERSLYSTRYCFVQNDYISKTINGLEFSILDQYFEHIVNSNKVKIDLIVYLRADPEACLKRIKARSRNEETSLPLSFLQSLHDRHDDWLIHEKYPLPAPVLVSIVHLSFSWGITFVLQVLDANYDLDKMKETYDSRKQEILFGCR